MASADQPDKSKSAPSISPEPLADLKEDELVSASVPSLLPRASSPVPDSKSQTFWKEYLKDKTYLFYCESMKPLALKIKHEAKGRVILGTIEWNVFEDGFPNLKVKEAYKLRWAHVAFLADLSVPRNIFEQYAVMCALPRYLARSVKIFVGYFPTGTMERVEEYGRVATAKSLARLLSSIPTGAHGPVQVAICDIHTLQNHFYFSDNILVRLETCTGLIKDEMRSIKHCSVAFPDEGAYKRYNRIFRKYPSIICTKVRDGDKRVVTLKEGEVKDRNVIIIDDLVKTGGTLAKCAALMKTEGCASVSCFVTHPVFPQESWKRFCDGGKNAGLFETFYVTDTIPAITAELEQHPPYKVLSTATVFVPIIIDDEDAIPAEV